MRGRRRGFLVKGSVAGLLVASGVSLLAVEVLNVDPASAAITRRVKNACRSDYYRFCSKYSVGTTELKQCMRSSGRRLSRPCIEALIDAGEVPRRMLRNARRRSRRR